uniref:Uncharacterized protein n=2 Tax=Anopheles arabiensis TaxID=7173 RepID=A0A182IGP7_ANOAR
MKMSRKVTSRRNKKLAAMSIEYDRQNMLDEEDAGISGMAHRNISGLFTVEHVGKITRPASLPSSSVSDLQKTQLNLIQPSSAIQFTVSKRAVHAGDVRYDP